MDRSVVTILHRRVVLLAALAALWAMGESAFGQDVSVPERLSLEEAFKVALSSHPRLQQRAHEARAADERIRGVASAYWPRIQVQAIAKDGLSGATGGLGFVGLPASPFFDKLAASVNVDFTAYDFGRTGNRLRAARFTAASLLSRERAERARIVWDVESAYYRCLQAEEFLRLIRGIVEERKLTTRQAQVYFDVELRSRLDVNLARVRLSEAEAERTRAGNERLLRYAELNRALGVRGRESYELDEADARPEDAGPLPELLERALSVRPDLLALEQQVRAAEASLSTARSERLPKVMAVASAGPARFDEGFEGDDRWAVGVGVSVPLFTGFDVESRIGAAKENLQAIEAAREDLLQQVHLEVEKAYRELQTTQALAEAADERLTLASESFGLANQRYAAQLGSFLEVTQAELVLNRARYARVEARYDAHIAKATLDYVVGESLPGDELKPEASVAQQARDQRTRE